MTRPALTVDQVAALANAACLSGIISLFALGSGLPHVVTLGLWVYGTVTLYPPLRGRQKAREAERMAHQAARELQQRLLERMTK